jgi:hypothetical protein
MPNKKASKNQQLTKKAFERFIRKAAQALLKKPLAPKETGTSFAHLSDDYNGTDIPARIPISRKEGSQSLISNHNL